MIRIIIRNNKVILILTQIANAIFGLIIGKIIAKYISPEHYGIFVIQFAFYTLLFTLLIGPFLQYVKTTSKTTILKIGHKFYLYLISGLSIILYIVLTLFFALKFPGYNYLYLLFLFIIPLNFIFSLMSDYFNIFNFINLFSVNSLIKNLGSLIFLSVLVYLSIKFSDGVYILWLVQLIGFIFSIYFFVKYYKIVIQKVKDVLFSDFLKEYYKYAWPLMILAFWGWVNNFFDRYAIEYYLDMGNVGIYNANYSLGSKFFLLLNPIFLTLLTPKIYNTTNSIQKKKEEIFNIVKIYSLLSITGLIILFFTTNFIGSLLLSESYEKGFYLIFWIATAYFFLTVVFFYEMIFYSNGNTKIILYSNVISAIFNIGLNVLLIPIYGLNGAIIATLISFIIRFIIIQYYYKKL